MNKIKILCICTILAGIGLFTFTCIKITPSYYFYRWLMGIAAALIILGLGYLINVLIIIHDRPGKTDYNTSAQGNYRTFIKEKSGYLVCKIMNILLCVYLLVLNEIGTKPTIMILGIALVVIQFLLDFIFQIYFLTHNRDE